MATMNGFCSVTMAFVIIGAALFFALDPVAAKVDLSCAKSLSHKCGVAIAKRIKLEKGHPFLTARCCEQLMSIGRPCHDAFIQAYKESGHFKGRMYRRLVNRGNNLWDHCSIPFPNP